MLHSLLTILLGPLLLLQGSAVRRRVERLPEAKGPREGRAGEGPLLRLIVIGDSSGAGVGAETQREALTGQIVTGLAAGVEVRWTIEARSGHTTEDALVALAEREPAPFDAAVTALGVNDVVARHSVSRWLSNQRELRERLRSRFRVKRIIVSGLPPVHDFPALPQPLRWYLGRRAREFDQALADDVARESDVHFLPLDFERDAAAMATDGFHPGPRIYAEWGRRAARAIRP